LAGEDEGKRSSGRARHRENDTIKINLKEIGWLLWYGFVRVRIGPGASSCKYSDEPSCSIKYWKLLD
jgi:hypothetical protein